MVITDRCQGRAGRVDQVRGTRVGFNRCWGAYGETPPNGHEIYWIIVIKFVSFSSSRGGGWQWELRYKSRDVLNLLFLQPYTHIPGIIPFFFFFFFSLIYLSLKKSLNSSSSRQSLVGLLLFRSIVDHEDDEDYFLCKRWNLHVS